MSIVTLRNLINNHNLDEKAIFSWTPHKKFCESLEHKIAEYQEDEEDTHSLQSSLRILKEGQSSLEDMAASFIGEDWDWYYKDGKIRFNPFTGVDLVIGEQLK